MKEKLTKVKSNRHLTYFLPLIVLLLIVIFFTVITNGKFARVGNLKIILNQSLMIAIVATGGVFIFSSGNMNLAMGGSTAVAALLGAKLYLQTGSFVATFICCIGVGLLITAICLVLSQVLKINIVLVTLVLMSLLTALQEWIVGASPVKIDYSLLMDLQKSNLTLYMGLLFFLLCVFIYQAFSLSRKLTFIGENQVCARQTGMNAFKVVTVAFLISGIGIGIGAFVFIVRNGTITQNSCSSLNMDVMLAIVLAGTPLNGGVRSKIYSGLVGALMTMVMNNGLLMCGIDSTFIQAVKGVIFIIILITSNHRPDVLPVNDMV